MIEFNIDRNAPSPVYIQIRQAEKSFVLGSIRPERYPACGKIAEMAGVSLAPQTRDDRTCP